MVDSSRSRLEETRRPHQWPLRRKPHIVTPYRTVAGYPEPLRSDLTGSVFNYTQSVIQAAWPAQQHGEVNEKGTEILFSVELRILEFEPATGGQSIVQAEALSALNTLVLLC
jgi:hypothetical protein